MQTTKWLLPGGEGEVGGGTGYGEISGDKQRLDLG